MGDEAGAVKLLRQVVKQGLQSEVDEAEQMLAELKQE
jgi:FimV-like protein